ncbi:UDP-3-O-(3-hydroxymyristoyl)glucosamine N-acyltransferase [Bremerella alba]|nr:UDP-3-O-(3-hydroxymyristoyl)glucosamine N-acyltransferase [Bremerella alba]
MGTTLAQLAELVDGKVFGDPDRVITGANIIRDAVAGEITLMDKPDQTALLMEDCQASAVLVREESEKLNIDGIVVANVHEAFGKIIRFFQPWEQTASAGIHRSAIVSLAAVVDPTATIGAGAVICDGVAIGKNAVIHSGVHIQAGCRIGEEVVIFPGAVLYDRTEVGDRCIIHANAVLGAFGFGYDSSSGKHILSAQLGNVVLESDVEIGAGAMVDRGTYGSTLIGEGTKIDNTVQIGHNCRLGKHNLICSQVGIAGSSTTGDYVVMAGQVGVRDHVHIGTGAMIGAKAGIGSDIPNGQQTLGVPGGPAKVILGEHMAIKKLPEMRKTIKSLVKRIEQLEKEAAAITEPVIRKAS